MRQLVRELADARVRKRSVTLRVSEAGAIPDELSFIPRGRAIPSPLRRRVKVAATFRSVSSLGKTRTRDRVSSPDWSDFSGSDGPAAPGDARRRHPGG